MLCPLLAQSESTKCNPNIMSYLRLLHNCRHFNFQKQHYLSTPSRAYNPLQMESNYYQMEATNAIINVHNTMLFHDIPQTQDWLDVFIGSPQST